MENTEKTPSVLKDTLPSKAIIKLAIPATLALMAKAVYNLDVYKRQRASRTVPLVSKVCNIRMVPLATDIITSELTGRQSPVPELKEQDIPYYGVKEAVFPFNMFQEVDPVLGPEMRSTGEVLGLAKSYGEAFFKAQEGVQSRLPLEGTVLISVNDKDKDEVVQVAKSLSEDGFKIVATGGTYALIKAAGIPADKVKKGYEGRPNVADLITNGDIQLIINSPIGKDDVQMCIRDRKRAGLLYSIRVIMMRMKLHTGKNIWRIWLGKNIIRSSMNRCARLRISGETRKSWIR